MGDIVPERCINEDESISLDWIWWCGHDLREDERNWCSNSEILIGKRELWGSNIWPLRDENVELISPNGKSNSSFFSTCFSLIEIEEIGTPEFVIKDVLWWRSFMNTIQGIDLRLQKVIASSNESKFQIKALKVKVKF